MYILPALLWYKIRSSSILVLAVAAPSIVHKLLFIAFEGRKEEMRKQLLKCGVFGDGEGRAEDSVKGRDW